MGQQVKLIKCINGVKTTHYVDESLVDRVLGMSNKTVQWEMAPESEQIAPTPAASYIPTVIKPLTEQLAEKTLPELQKICKEKNIKFHPKHGKEKLIEIILNFAAL